jgi:hypothetical protein
LRKIIVAVFWIIELIGALRIYKNFGAEEKCSCLDKFLFKKTCGDKLSWFAK